MPIDFSHLVEGDAEPLEEYTLQEHFGDRLFSLMPRSRWTVDQELRVQVTLLDYQRKLSKLLDNVAAASTLAIAEGGYPLLVEALEVTEHYDAIAALFEKYMRGCLEAKLGVSPGTFAETPGMLLLDLWGDVNNKLLAEAQENVEEPAEKPEETPAKKKTQSKEPKAA